MSSSVTIEQVEITEVQAMELLLTQGGRVHVVAGFKGVQLRVQQSNVQAEGTKKIMYII